MDFKPGYREEPSGRLEEFLSKDAFPLGELFAVPSILTDIKTSMARFLKYLSTRKALTEQLISFATRLTDQQLQQDAPKRWCFIAIEILCNEDDELTSLFFNNGQEEEITEEISPNNEIQQLLFNDEAVISNGGDPIGEGEMLHYLMEFLQGADIEREASNSYFAKVVNSLIRKEGCSFLGFMVKNPHYVELLLQKVGSAALGSIVVKLLITDTEDVEKKGTTLRQCKEFKSHIVMRLKEMYLTQLQNLELCESICMLVEEGFQSIRNKFFEFPTDMVEAFNLLANKSTIDTFGSVLLSTGDHESLGSACMFLTMILKKLNREVEEYIESQRGKKAEIEKHMAEGDFILRFEVDWLFQHFEGCVELLTKPIFLANNNVNKHKFTSLLVELVKVPKFWLSEKPLETGIGVFFNELSKYTGVLQNDFYCIAKSFIERTGKDRLEHIGDTLNVSVTQHQPDQLKSLNNDTAFGPEINLLLLIESKHPELIQESRLKDKGIDLEEVKQKQKILLGGSQPSCHKSSIFDFDDQPVRVFEEPVHSLINSGQEGGQMRLVGKKKNIVLPNLRYMSEIRKTKQTTHGEIPKSEEELEACIQEEKNNVIEVEEEEIVLTLPLRLDKQIKSSEEDNSNGQGVLQEEVSQEKSIVTEKEVGDGEGVKGVENEQACRSILQNQEGTRKEENKKQKVVKTDQVKQVKNNVSQKQETQSPQGEPSRPMVKFHSLLYLIS